jgi:hypothetical protein
MIPRQNISTHNSEDAIEGTLMSLFDAWALAAARNRCNPLPHNLVDEESRESAPARRDWSPGPQLLAFAKRIQKIFFCLNYGRCRPPMDESSQA